jgi:hypothetical protein
MPFYPQSVTNQKNTSTPYPFVVFTFRLIVESIKEFGGVSLYPPLRKATKGVYFVKGGNILEYRVKANALLKPRNNFRSTTLAL